MDRNVFGAYSDQTDRLCDGDDVARILTLRAAAEGVYRVYDKKAVMKAVQRGNITPVLREGELRYHLYLIDDAWTMECKPLRGRKSPSVDEYNRRLEALLERAQHVHVPKWKIDNARRILNLAIEAESVSEEVLRLDRALESGQS